MSTRVLKWGIEIDDQWHKIGRGPVVLVGRYQDTGTGFDRPQDVGVWTVEDEAKTVEYDKITAILGNPGRDRVARVYGTGQAVHPLAEHLGSYIAGELVWHVFGLWVDRDTAQGPARA